MSFEKEILSRLERLEEPYGAISKAVADGVLAALIESGLTISAQPSPIVAAPQQAPVSDRQVDAVAEAIRPVLPDIQGVCAAIGALPAGSIINEQGLANILGKCPTSIKRAVSRRELPPPTRLMGKPTWTAGALIKHIERRLEDEAKDAERLKRRVDRLSV